MMKDLFGSEIKEQSWEEKYQAYLHSPKWKIKRQQALQSSGYKCQRCGRSRWSSRLEVHHLTYEHFTNESLNELIVVCEKCHELEDKEREQRTATKQATRLWNARLDGWASKVYGEHWQELCSQDLIEDEFEEWLESHG